MVAFHISNVFDIFDSPTSGDDWCNGLTAQECFADSRTCVQVGKIAFELGNLYSQRDVARFLADLEHGDQLIPREFSDLNAHGGISLVVTGPETYRGIVLWDGFSPLFHELDHIRQFANHHQHNLEVQPGSILFRLEDSALWAMRTRRPPAPLSLTELRDLTQEPTTEALSHATRHLVYLLRENFAFSSVIAALYQEAPHLILGLAELRSETKEGFLPSSLPFVVDRTSPIPEAGPIIGEIFDFVDHRLTLLS